MAKKNHFHVLIIVSTVFILTFYGKIIVSPNNYLFTSSGDGIKNYYTYAYHIKNDSSYVNFAGMNYPYGEHFLYTDCHPILANSFKLLSNFSDFFINYSIGILNFILIISIFLTFYVLYFLFRELGVNNWINVLFSLGITILSPQIFRLNGHLALSYSLAIPLTWLLCIKSLKHYNNFKYLFLLFINNIFWLFIHAYLGIIALFFVACIVCVNLIADKNRKAQILHYIKNLSAIFLPILIFFIFTILTDTHTNRTNNPSGFFLYNAELDDVFLPHHPPFKSLFYELSNKTLNQEWEAWSYVGISTTLVFSFLLIFSILRFVKLKKSAFYNLFFNSKILNLSLVSSILVLLFAMSIPFKQIPSLVDFIPFIKQFRATGRFTWPFYFTSIIFVAMFLNQLYLKTISKKLKYFTFTIIGVIGFLNIYEGIYYHIETSKSITKTQNLFNKKFISQDFKNALDKINVSDFQAIIALPFYYYGSESYELPRKKETVKASILTSYFTGIPMFCANLTRTSIWESKNIVQLVTPNFYEKEIIKDLPSKKDFLVIRTSDGISKYESEIFSKCNLIYKSAEISIYSIKKEDLFKNSSNSVIDKFKNNESKLFKNKVFMVSKDSAFLYFDSFENSKSEKIFRGKGAFQSVKIGKNILAQFSNNTFQKGKKYHASVWMYNGLKDALNGWFRFIIEEYNKKTNSWSETTYFPEQSEVIYGNWSLIEADFEVKNPANKIYIVTKGTDESKGAFFADDLLITEKGVDVYLENENVLFYNNHDLKVK